ncbi:MAG: phosphopyruvate hydratase [Gammaproteobacteria bacterium]|nr:phosphopyruvate hydratase [Gammaproteobacteria bacterium]
MSRIVDVNGIEAFDSRGNPTILAAVTTSDGHKSSALVPSGASVGSLEAVEMRDGDAGRFQGRGVRKALQGITQEIKGALVGKSVEDQAEIDKTLCDLDGTPNKARLGANAILGVSLANAHAAAASKGLSLYRHINDLVGNPPMTLPVPMLNVLNGGAHANNNVDIQEFMVVPSGVEDFSTAVQAAAEIFYTLKQNLASKGISTAVGDEGGFAPDLSSDIEAIELLITAIERSGWQLGEKINLALDCAATEFFVDGHYRLESQNRTLTREEWIDEMEEISSQFPAITSIEDGIHESDYEGWKKLNQALGSKMQLVGDDLFVTNPGLLNRGIADGWANAILIKLNQIGTLSETLEVIQIAQSHGLGTVISHRSGDTEDTTIADLAVGTSAGQIKTGSMSRSERVAKYNRLLQINQELENPVYAGS